jgi:hypothetical protein
MKQFNLLYEHILEEMNRRDFLKTLGKGAKVVAANNLIPGGIVGTALKGALSNSPSPFNLKTELLYFHKPELFFKKIGPHHFTVNTVVEGDQIIRNLKTNFGRIFAALTSKALPGQAKIVKDHANTINYLNNALYALHGGRDVSRLGYDYRNMSNVEVADMFLSHVHGDVISPEMMDSVWDSGLITPEIEAEFKQKYGIDRKNYQPDRFNEELPTRDEVDKEIQKLKNDRSEIGSRFDYAGGSEDQGYAKYYENYLRENYADGKNPGRKGLAKRSGVNTKASVSSLRKTAKNSTGEKARMAHWMANMKAGKKKAKK